tara:strand:- start:2689 stop:2949 length:261 start_codon:yes stop_codon:yes gene_type:complete
MPIGVFVSRIETGLLKYNMNKNFSEVEFQGKKFKIPQVTGRCCESDCSGCELYKYKISKGLPVQNSRASFYARFAKYHDENDNKQD